MGENLSKKTFEELVTARKGLGRLVTSWQKSFEAG